MLVAGQFDEKNKPHGAAVILKSNNDLIEGYF